VVWGTNFTDAQLNNVQISDIKGGDTAIWPADFDPETGAHSTTSCRPSRPQAEPSGSLLTSTRRCSTPGHLAASAPPSGSCPVAQLVDDHLAGAPWAW
jgi:hypothetical protein